MGAGASVPGSEEEALALGYTADDIRRYQEAKQQEEDKDSDEEDDAPLAPLATKFSSPKESDHPALVRRVSVIERKLASHGKAGEGGGASAGAGSENLKPSDFDQYVAFVPRRMLPRLPAMATTKPSATMEKLEGVVSFLDLAGFTKLTERLALQVALFITPLTRAHNCMIIARLLGFLEESHIETRCTTSVATARIRKSK